MPSDQQVTLPYANEAYRKMKELRPILFQRFGDDQEKAVERIYRLLHPLFRTGRISRIIDLGCGTGEILHGLWSRVSDELSSTQAPTRKNPSFIGIDNELGEINDALENFPANKCPGLSFAEGKAEDCVEVLKKHGISLESDDWDHTCIICTGHTVAHFDWAAFEVFLRCQHPKYLLIDFFHTFDWVLKELNKKVHEAIEEPMACIPPKKNMRESVYVRRTIAQNDTTIRRQVVEYQHNESHPFSSTCITHLDVEQQRLTSSDYLAKLLSLKYFMDAEVFYPAGYGFMFGCLCVYKCADADMLNTAYHTAVDDLITRMVSLPEVKELLTQNTLNGVTAVTILPFDSHFTFARYSQSKDFQRVTGADKAPIFEMQLDAPRYRPQYPFLPAPSLYSCILGMASQMNVVRLSEHMDYLSSSLDNLKPIPEQEELYLKTCLNGQNETERAKALKEGLFYLLPFYCGFLPLFCLVVNFEKKTTHDTCLSCLKGIRDLLGSTIKKHRLEFLRTFALRAIDELVAKSIISRADAKTRLELFLSCAKEKKWKSWALASPTQPIKSIREAILDEDGLTTEWKSALDIAVGDPLLTGSMWLKSGGFFAAANHNAPKLNHLKALKTMLENAYIKCDHPTQKDILEGLESLCDRPVPNVCKVFFGPCLSEGGHLKPELNWLVHQLKAMAAGLDCNLAPTDDQTSAAASMPFLKVKSVYCRSNGDMGDDYRFSLCRLACLIEIGCRDMTYEWNDNNIFTGKVKLNQNDALNVFSEHLGVSGTLKFQVNNDNSRLIVEMASNLGKLSCDQIQIEVKSAEDLHNITIIATHSAFNRNTTSGQDGGEYKRWITEHCRPPDNFADLPNSYAVTELKLSLRVVENNNKSGKPRSANWEFSEGFPYEMCGKELS